MSMGVYYIVISPAKEGGYSVYVPGWDVYTQGETYEECIRMARDVIGLCGIDYEDDGKPFPTTVGAGNIARGKDDVIALVDVDFMEYRMKNDRRSVKQNCSVPLWLHKEAKKKKVNFSRILQDGLKKYLGFE